MSNVPRVKYIFVDTETTGTDPKKHSIIQLAAIYVEEAEAGNLVEKGHINLNMQPFPQDEVDPEALRVGGFTAEQLLTFDTPQVAYGKLLGWLSAYIARYDKKDKAIFVGYNVDFDEHFVREFFIKNDDKFFGSWFWWPSVDVAKMVMLEYRATRANFVNFKLGTLIEKERVGVEGQLHDAQVDISATLELFKNIFYRRKYYGEKINS